MTNDQTTKLADLQANYDRLNTLYGKALAENNTGHANLSQSVWVFPYSGAQTDETSFKTWIQQSDASLVTYKTLVDTALRDLNAYKDFVRNSTIDNFATTNPQLYADYLKNQDTVNANKEGKLFAQKSTWYILGGVIFVVVVIFGIVIYKRYKK